MKCSVRDLSRFKGVINHIVCVSVTHTDFRTLQSCLWKSSGRVASSPLLSPLGVGW